MTSSQERERAEFADVADRYHELIVQTFQEMTQIPQKRGLSDYQTCAVWCMLVSSLLKSAWPDQRGLIRSMLLKALEDEGEEDP